MQLIREHHSAKRAMQIVVSSSDGLSVCCADDGDRRHAEAGFECQGLRAKASWASRFGIAAMPREVPVVRQSCDANIAPLSLSQRDDGIAFHRGLVLLSQHHEIAEVQS